MFVGSTSFNDRRHLEPRVVELWEIGHTDGVISFACSPQRGEGTRVVELPLSEIRKLERRRRAGDYWTRCLVTIPRGLVERLQLAPWQAPVFVDALFRLESADPQARRVGARHNHLWCHLFCAPGDEDHLHAIAVRIGMRREWFQDKDGFPHYDLVPPRRVAAVRAGAQETNLREWLEARRRAAAAGHGAAENNGEGTASCPTR